MEGQRGHAQTDRTDVMATRRFLKRAARGRDSEPTLHIAPEAEPEEEQGRALDQDEQGLDEHDEADSEDDEAAPLADEHHQPHPEGEGEDDDHAPDDALGLYLRQMGAIPLLSRERELALAKELELRRSRYRHAALSCWFTLERVVATFERVNAGQLALDPTIDVVNTLGLSRENILKRIPYHVRTLRRLVKKAD